MALIITEGCPKLGLARWALSTSIFAKLGLYLLVGSYIIELMRERDSGNKETWKPRVSDRHRRFAELIVQGIPAGRAYERSGFRARGASADTEASKTLRNPKIAAEIDLLRTEAASTAAIDRRKAIEILTTIILAAPSEASMESPLCEIRIVNGKRFPVFPGKLRCIEQLSKMLGWYDSKDFSGGEITVVIGGDDHLPSLLKRIRSKNDQAC